MREQPLKRFADSEKLLLAPLLAVPPELRVWAQVNLHRDGHVQFERVLSSAPGPPFSWLSTRVEQRGTADDIHSPAFRLTC